MRFSSRPRAQSGFTLLEVLLAIGISLTIGAVALTDMRRTNESKQARAVGQQLAVVGSALNTYMAIQYDDIVNLREQPGPGPGTADDPSPRYCTANVTTIDGNPVAVCTITVQTLVRSGLLPRNFSGRNAFGSGYDLYIRVIGAAEPYIMDGLAVVRNPYTTDGTTPRYDLMGQAMQEAGADSAMTRTVGTKMEGLNGTWNDDVWPAITHDGENYPGVNQLGLLGYRAGYGSSAYASFLRRDGTLPMTGFLNMDGNNIEDINGLDAQFAHIQNQIQLNTNDTGDGLDRTEIVGGVGSMIIANREGVFIEDLAGDPGSLSVGALTASGNMSLNGDITVSGNIQAQDIRGRHAHLTHTAQIDGELHVGLAGGGPRVSLFNGEVRASGDIHGNQAHLTRANVGTGADRYSLTNTGLTRDGSPMWFYDTTAAAWRVGGGAGSNIYADGNITAYNTLTAGRVQVTGAGNAATLGATCTAAGEMRRAGSELVQCVDGRWKVMGVRTVVQDSANITVAVSGSPVEGTATCPTGTTVVGGGYLLTANPTGSPGGGLDSRSPARSYPNGNGWTVRTGQDNGAGTSFVARALCAY